MSPSPPLARRGLIGISAVYFAVLAIASDGYGYHRDELYFLAIGGHPAFGYVDQPPLVPLLAHAMDAMSGHSLVALRLPAALAGALVVFVTGLIAREFGGERAAQCLAAATMAAASVLAATAHVASTAIFDLLGWTVLSWLVVKALRDDGRVWLLVGLVAGIDLEIKTLPVFVLFALLVGVLAVGPREVLTSRWLWAGTAVAVALWAPNIAWQATHDWPQFKLSSSIAGGNSTSSQPRPLFVPFQFLLVSPLLFPVWVAGLWRLWRDRALATWRCFAVAYPVLAVIFIAAGGKPYYLCGMYPALLAAGAEPTLRWARSRARRLALGAAVGLSMIVTAVLMLPIVPVAHLHQTPIVAANPDTGETVGWPRFAATIGRAYDALPGPQRAHAIVLGENYGEAGAVLRFRPDVPAYSPHNSMWTLGPPPDDTSTVVAVGYGANDLRAYFTSVRRVGRIDNGVDLDNDEQDNPVWVCTGPKQPWPQIWDELKRYG